MDDLIGDQELESIYQSGSTTTHIDGLRAVYAAGSAPDHKALATVPRREMQQSTNQISVGQDGGVPKAGPEEAVSYDGTTGEYDVKPSKPVKENTKPVPPMKKK